MLPDHNGMGSVRGTRIMREAFGLYVTLITDLYWYKIIGDAK